MLMDWQFNHPGFLYLQCIKRDRGRRGCIETICTWIEAEDGEVVVLVCMDILQKKREKIKG